MIETHLNTYKETRKKIMAYNYADWVLGWDMETETPSNSFEFRSKQIEIFQEEKYKIEMDKNFLESVSYLYENIDKLDKVMQSEIKATYKQLRIIKLVPKDEYINYQVLLSSSGQVWSEAKENNDFNHFAPTLEKIINYNRKLVKYLQTDELKGYDVLLDMYEDGYNTKEYDKFFDSLKDELVDFVMQVTKVRKLKSKKLNSGFFTKYKQKEFSLYLLDILKFDKTRGLLKESAHPFTSNVSSTDVRITTRYIENNLVSSIFSTIHEFGHALYEQQISKELLYTLVGRGTSLGIHESQSRMFENMIGRSYTFWEAHYPKLKEIFSKELSKVDLLEFYQHINTVKRSLIRTEADELTYSLHIMVRYEIEKLLIDGKLQVKDIQKKWRLLYQKYVGVRPKNDQEGVLQDIHWAFGLIGYFPTYALGSAYAAQIYQSLNKDVNIENAISNNNYQAINEWLKEKIHKYGATLTPKEIIRNATGEDLDPKYYIEYLKRKFAV